MPTITKRNNSYKITVSCGYDSKGKQIRKTKTWTPSPSLTKKQTEKELERQAVLFEEQVRTGHYLRGNVKFADFVETYLKDYAELQLRPRTLQTYRQLKHRSVEAIGNLPLDRIQPQHLTAFYKNLSEPGIRAGQSFICHIDLLSKIKEKGMGVKQFCELAQISDTTLMRAREGLPVSGISAKAICRALEMQLSHAFEGGAAVLSASTVKHYHTFLSSVFERAVKWGIILYNPCRRIDPPKAERKPPKYLNEEEAACMLALLQKEDEPFRTLFTLLLFTGMRRGEAMGLEWKDIDFQAGVLSVCRTSQYTSERGVFTDDVKTTSSRRSMKLPEEVIDRLKQYKLWQDQERDKAGDSWQNTDRLFTLWNGAPMNPGKPYFWLRDFLERNDLPQISVHSLRHT